nr:serine/threonine-protein kinase [Kibdelosporangium sp. MJ126-NF4]CEL22942.1 serine/threonine protein kinase [Kibdelosporangium sp. MJ126-NF4]CTQ90081.1 serine/threonine protein kinase [Kibdelosporangium sp. MJ126-NF4]
MTAVTQAGHLVGGRYRLISELGAGGFGRVWKAHDETLDVYVAVKELKLPRVFSSREQSERLTRAAREARNAAALRDHPNIVAVHDVAIHEDSPWIVMQLVDGHSIDDLLAAGGPLPADTVTKVAVALLRALDAAHRLGIVHRDVKPGNVMLAKTGEVLLTDFGIAVQATDTALTATGVFVGSMEYVAPERLHGRETTAASDLFSLGATLYHAVEGTSPFRRDDHVATLGAVLVDEPKPPTLAPPLLAAVIARLLAKDPRRRPTVGQALAMITGEAGTPEPPITADRTELLTMAAGAMKAELAHRIGKLAAEHGIAFASPARVSDRATMVKPSQPRTPTRRVRDKPRKRRPWRRATGLALLVVLFGIGVFGIASRHWNGAEFWHSFEAALGPLAPDTAFFGFIGASALFAIFLALSYGVGGARRIGRAVGPAGGGAKGVARFVFGVGGFAFGVILFYCTVLGGAQLLTLDNGTVGGVQLWIALAVVVVVQTIGQIWSGEQPRKQD